MPHAAPRRDPKDYEAFYEVRVDGELILEVFRRRPS
jgi:hypothetical protein